jgi:hypothetical protein
MSRPLIYDDQFKALLKNDTKEKFFFCIPMKVQSSAFYKSVSLQNSIRVCSIYDFICGFFILFCGNNSFWEIFFIILFFCFGVLSIHNSINISKTIAKYYYYWRIFITFFIPIEEFMDYEKEKICYYSKCMTFFYYAGLSLGISIINIYAAKIAWSFHIRLQKGHDLLAIHGKYLENMISNENNRIANTHNELMKSNYAEIEMGKKKESSIIPSNNEEENK